MIPRKPGAAQVVFVCGEDRAPRRGLVFQSRLGGVNRL